MPFSFETFAWAVSALFQLLTVCAYLLSFPDVDGVDDQLPDMPEVIQDSAIEKKITYSGIIFVFGFYTQVVVVKQRWNWWRKKMEEPDNSLMVMVGVYVHNLICTFFQVSHASMVFSSNLGTWLRKASCTTCGPPFFLASVFLVGICIVAGLGFFSDTWTSFLVLREKVRARMKEQEDATIVKRQGRVLSNNVGRKPIQHVLVFVVLRLLAQDVLVLSHDHVGLIEEGIGRLAAAC